MSEWLEYPAHLEADGDGGFVVTFPDVPEAITQGETEADALRHARDALGTALGFYVESRKPLPAPSPAHGSRTVAPDALVCAKLGLYQAMLAQGVTKAELGRRLGWHSPQVERVLDPNHASRIDQVEAALSALGRRLSVAVREAA